MRTKRREFDASVLIAILRRATDSSGAVHCERCGAWCPKRSDFEIDHIISEGIRPEADKRRKLRPADGQLLCKAVCHRDKTRRDDGAIAEAKRREARHVLTAPGPTAIARRFGIK